MIRGMQRFDIDQTPSASLILAISVSCSSFSDFQVVFRRLLAMANAARNLAALGK
jgi:hypothetical protein